MKTHTTPPIVLTLALLLAASAVAFPPDDPLPSLEPGPYLVGLETVPRDLEEGDVYLGERVVKLNRAVDTLVLDVTDPVAFEAKALADLNVRYHHPDDKVFTTLFVPSEDYYDCCQWGITDVNIETAWDTTLGDTTVRLAVLDTGLRKSHEDIGNYLQGHDYIDDDNEPNDCNGHGTHVASTAAGLTNNGVGVAGVAQAEILPVRVLDCEGSGTFSQIIDGITFATNQGAHIISMSLGASVGSPGLLDAVDYAWDNGVLVVAAAGNDGPCTDCIGYPAKYDNVIAVTAYDQDQQQASFSNEGPESEIAAPGVQIAAAYHRDDSDYVYLDGTSMATPIVSGVAALGLTVDGSITNVQMRQMLRDTARDFGATGWDPEFGYGAVDADALVAAALSGGGGGGGTVVYEEDFEGATNFVKSSASNDLWRLSSGCLGGNGGRSLQFNEADCNYSTGAQVTGWARTELDLSGATTATLSFDHKWETETYSGGAYDVMRVQAASCTSCTWTTLDQWDSRDANQLTWGGETFDLSSWAGDGAMYVRFHFDSLDGSYNNYDGWAVDNFLVTKE